MRDFDLMLLGATGFTGRQAVAWMKEHATGIRWGVAGRNKNKLDELGVPSMVVDTDDARAVDELASSTRVLLSTAGPYLEHGTPVVEACVRHGTHYADLTGETPWIRQLVDRYHDAAVRTGAAIVPSCGFDSVPSDLGAWLCVRQLRDLGESTRSVEGLFRAKTPTLNGGTLASVRNLVQRDDRAWMSDPRVLEPGWNPPGTPRAMTRVERDASGAWKAPFVMAQTNTAVVYRSAALSAERGHPYGLGFSYAEHVAVASAWNARAIAVGMRLTDALPGSLVASLTHLVGPSPGGGPSEKEMAEGFFRASFTGTGVRGTTVRAEIDSPGDPGNRSTVRMLCCAGLCLLDSADTGGILTPAFAIGDRLVDRLREHGVRITG